MDQLKVVLAVLKKHHFWFLSGLVLIVGLLAWWLATGGVAAEFAQFKSDVEQRIQEQQGIVQQNPAHPNDDVIAGFQAENKKLALKVYLVWKKLHEEQRTKVLFWPREMRNDFLRAIQGKKFGEDIPLRYRERYQNYVRERFGELSEIVQAREVELPENPTGGALGGPGGGPGGYAGEGYSMPSPTPGYGPGAGGPGRVGPNGELLIEEDPYIVEWLVANQAQLQSKLVWDKPPTSMKMWVTQEDLWVYESLLRIIAQTNVGATGPHNATVSVIEAIEAGQDAAPGSVTTGRIWMPPLAAGAGAPGAMSGAPGAMPPEGGPPGASGASGASGAPGAPPGMPGAMPGMPGAMPGMPGGPGGAGALTPEMLDQMLLAGRYLDAEGKPMPAPSAGAESEFAALTEEFKRVPVRLVLRMDPREIPRLLVACANAVLPVEVQQVRLNVDPNSGGGIRGGVGGPGGSGGPGGGSNYGGMSGPGAGPGMGYGGGNAYGGAPGANLPGEGQGGLGPRQVPQQRVVIQGIIYIYNPPNLEKLGLTPEDVQNLAPAAPVGNVAQPAGQPAPAAQPVPPAGQPAPAQPAPVAGQPVPGQPAPVPAGGRPAPAAQPVPPAGQPAPVPAQPVPVGGRPAPVPAQPAPAPAGQPAPANP